MDDREKFLKLVSENAGFEICLGFRSDFDHFIGGTGNYVWYDVQKGSRSDCYIGSLNKDGSWTDRHLVKTKVLKEEPAKAGTTIKMITDRLYFKQAEIEASGRKPVTVELGGHKCLHYVFSFGARAYEILEEYGVNASYSNIDDEEAGYRMRSLHTGKDVKVPAF